MQGAEYDWHKVAAYLGLGAGFAASTLAFTVFGIFLDGRWGTSPLFTLAGVLVGATAGFYSLYRRAIAVQRQEEEERSRGERRDRGSEIPNNS